jgi:YesN/AraC family two-component response regulator
MSDPGFSPHSSAVLAGPRRETRKKVLIVDDEYLIRYSLKKLIEREGYTVFTAGSGHEALRLFEEQRPDIVILDIRLPDSNGLSLLKTIKESRPSVATIMATGCPDVQSSDEAMKMGALAYLEKPVDLDSLKTLMRGTAPAATQIQ